MGDKDDMYTISLPVSDGPNKNGDVFPRELTEEAIKEYLTRGPGLVYSDVGSFSQSARLEDAVGVLRDVEVGTDTVTATVALLSTPHGDEVQKMIRMSVPLSCGIGGSCRTEEEIYKYKGFFGWLLNFGAWLLEVLRIKPRRRVRVVKEANVSHVAVLPPMGGGR
jgi:hypothetical protein